MTFASDNALKQAEIVALINTATGYLAELKSVANSVIVEGTTVLPESYNYASVPQVSFPVYGYALRPDITDISNAQPPESPEFSYTSLSTVSLPADDLVAPTAVFAFAEATYESVLLDPLKAKLLYDLQNGGYGIDTTDEVALFNRARDREVEAMLSRIEDAGRTMAARGFPLPPGELSIHIDRAYQDMQDKVSSVSRDITLERSKLFVENRQFTIREVRELEQVLLNFHNAVQERAFNVARVTAEFAIVVYNALIARFRARLEAAKISADVQYQITQAEADQAKVKLMAFQGQIAAYEANLRRMLETSKIATDIYRVDTDSNRIVNDATIARATLQQKVIEATTQQNIQISNMTIENAKARILGVVESLRFKTSAAQFGSDRFFALLTALESSVNTLSVYNESA